MGKVAFLFAGQGAQAPGMGKSLYQHSPAAKAVFDAMDAARPGTTADCFEADAERLKETAVTQPCVYTVDLACAAALKEAGVAPAGVAGFSLGELAALAFAGALSAEDGAKLVCRRGEVMQKANEENPGAMAAVLRMDDDAVEALCARHADVWPVNYNCPGQVVVAGRRDALPAFCAAVAEAGGRAQPLAVGGAFHTPLMEAAACAFAEVVKAADWRRAALPVYANLTALPYDADTCAGTLIAQMHHPVRWHTAMRQMAADGFDTFVEVGPGKALSGFARRILPEATVLNVQDAESLAATLETLKTS